MIVPYDVWLRIRQGGNLDVELGWWTISKSNTTSALWVEMQPEQKGIKHVSASLGC